MKTKTTNKLTFFKAGTWILIVAGFGHALTAIPDIFIPGMFSPATEAAMVPLRNISLRIVEIAHGRGTSLLESAWAAYTGFAISTGMLVGFIGLILLIILKNNRELSVHLDKLIPVLIIMNVLMVVISLVFFFYFPTILLMCSLVCFILAGLNRDKRSSYVTG